MVWSTEAVPANTPGHCGDLEFLIVRMLRSQTNGGSGEHSVWRDVMCTCRTPEPWQSMQIRLCLPIQLSISCPCQGFLSLTSGFLCSPASWWRHPACVTQARPSRVMQTQLNDVMPWHLPSSAPWFPATQPPFHCTRMDLGLRFLKRLLPE